MKHCSIKKILTLALLAFIVASPVFASETNGTITTGGNAGYAWSDQAGWVNFGATNSNIQITDSGIAGYAWNANYGWINMAPTNGGVAVSASGALSGYAWGSSLGWINFSGVSVNSSGKFVGQATGTIIGTLTFDCANCNVTTDYRPQNFRTTTTPTPITSSGGGGGGGGGGTILGLFGAVNGTPLSSQTPAQNTAEGGALAESNNRGGGGEPIAPPASVSAPSSNVTGQLSNVSTAPSQLFDINLEIENSKIATVKDLVARVIFTSFGRVPTPVDLTFDILDKSGKKVYSKTDKITVETQAVLTERFADAAGALTAGKYTLLVATLYNKNVRDEFKQDFEIIGTGKIATPFWKSIWFWVLSTVAFIAIFIVLIKKMGDDGEYEHTNG